MKEYPTRIVVRQKEFKSSWSTYGLIDWIKTIRHVNKKPEDYGRYMFSGDNFLLDFLFNYLDLQHEKNDNS